MTRLALTLPLNEYETPASYVSRLSRRNQTIPREFCSDLGMRWPHVCSSHADQLERLSYLWACGLVSQFSRNDAGNGHIARDKTIGASERSDSQPFSAQKAQVSVRSSLKYCTAVKVGVRMPGAIRSRVAHPGFLSLSPKVPMRLASIRPAQNLRVRAFDYERLQKFRPVPCRARMKDFVMPTWPVFQPADAAGLLRKPVF